MRHSPFESPRQFVRVIIKAVVILCLFNFVCLALHFDPLDALMAFNTQWLVGHGRERIYYLSDNNNGVLPIDAMLAAHEIAYNRKADDEFRIVLIGDSGINGIWLTDAETPSTLLTNRGIRINGKRAVFYNLSYPGPDIVKNTLTMDAAFKYQPDLVISFVGTTAFYNGRLDPTEWLSRYMWLNGNRLDHLVNDYKMQGWLAMYLAPAPALSQWNAIKNGDTFPIWLRSLFYPLTTTTTEWQGPRLEWEPVPAEVPYHRGVAGYEQMPNDTWKFLQIEQDIAAKHNVQLLVVNEPILVLPGPNYDSVFARDFYDDYRTALTQYSQQNGIWFADLWNSVPTKYFIDTPLHFDADGSKVVTEAIVQALLAHYGPATMLVPPEATTQSDAVQMVFDQKDVVPFGDGWLAPEGSQTWMGATKATLDFTLVPSRTYKVTFRIAQALTPDMFTSLRLSVNGQLVEISSQVDAKSGITFVGIIPESTIELDPDNTHLEFSVSHITSPQALGLNNDSRLLALKFNSLQIQAIMPVDAVF